MSNVSRNNPCPCGSGKKYKKCCIDKVLPFPKTSSFEEEQSGTTNDFFEKIKQHFKENQYHSINEINEQMGLISSKFNSRAQDDFLGLSPSQMRNALDSPLSFDNELFKFELESEKELEQVPLFNQALYFICKIKEIGELKATQKGNLPKLFVIDLYERFYSNEKFARKPNKEDDLSEITRLKHLLEISGLIKKRNNKFSLTSKASSILERNKKFELFELIFINFANKFNWALMDGYSELYLIQQSVNFNFFLLNKKCIDWTLAQDLGQLYLNAFPAITREVTHSNYSTPEEHVIRCFCLRFLNRFCLPLGIVAHKEERIKKGEYFNFLDYYCPTIFFKKNFKFKIT